MTMKIAIPHHINGQMVLGSDGKFTDAIQGLILRFLAIQEISSAKAASREEIMASADRNKQPWAGRIQYWKHVSAAIKLLAYRVVSKQTKFDSLDEEELERVIRSWNLPTTS